VSERSAAVVLDENRFSVSVDPEAVAEELELAKVFKFYYSDDEGAPDLSLAVARLIAETYGGELNAGLERDKVVLRLSLPLGAR
jgi:hypothetical protein